MKKIVFGLIAMLMMGYTVSAQVLEKVGTVKDGKFTITEDLAGIKEVWASFLKDQKIEGTPEDYQIKSGEDTELKQIYYYLIGTSSKKDLKIACQLILEKGDFYIEIESALPGTVTCTGCPSACDPYKSGGHWWCSLGCGGDCTKSVTVNTH